MCWKSSKDIEEPIRAMLRMDIVEPIVAKSKTDKHEAIFTMPNTENEDPSRAKHLKESDEPKWR
jgi:hypothetical protein